MTHALSYRPVAQACALLLLGLQVAQAQTTDSTPQTLDTVVVTGIRRGIEDAIATKHDNSSIVEAISSEDIGKLPDVTVAESLSRVSGVATQRDKVNGQATDVSVRGMSPSFNGSLLNGREQASTSDARSPEFDLFPAQLTSSVLIYKTPDASLVGQGLASTIDLRTIRPLDYGKRVVALGHQREQIGAESGSDLGSGNRSNLVYVDQFAQRSFGVALGLSSFREDNGGENRFDNWGGYAPTVDYNGQQVVVPGGFLAETIHRRSSRDAAFMTLQYKPTANFKTTADLLYSRGTQSEKHTGIEGAVPFGTGPYDPNGVLTDATIVNGVATGGTFSNYKADVRNHMYSSKDRLASLGLNSELRTGDWRWEIDAGHSRGVKNLSNFETTAGQPGNTPDSQLASITYSGFNGTNFADVKYTPSIDYSNRNIALLTDVDGWGGGPNSPQAGYVSLPNITDTVNSLRFTAHDDAGWGIFESLRYGFNFTKRDKARTGDEGRLYILGGDGYAAVKMPGTDVAMAGASGIPVASWDPTGSLGTIYGMTRWVDQTVLSRNWTVDEKVATAYIIGDLAGKLGNVPYHGNLGVQLVHTSQEASGNQVDLANCTGITVETCPYKVRTDGTSYGNVLPSLNLTFELGNQQLLRLGAGKQLARANLDDMKASLDFAVQNATSLQPALTGFAGNPKLKPYQARALDVSYEKYFDKYGYVSLAAFYKKLDNYIINAPRPFDFGPYTSASTPLPTQGPYAGSTQGFLTQPVNGQGGDLKGLELTVNLPFRMATHWLDGFGVTISHSLSDSSVRLPTSGFVSPENGPVFAGVVNQIGLPGLSKNVTTARLYYEKNGWQLSYAAYKRSDFIGQILDYRSDAQFTFIKAETIVDAQVGYEFQDGWAKGLSVSLQGHNLSNAPFQEYTASRDIITNSVKYGKTYRLGANYKF
ncbi:MAG: TonB-dependent receptor [Burkholderiaceae bacterium]|nr:TonB-dependent receptor [Burkholderiaceae bacterium]